MSLDVAKQKAVKELELMAKRIKKRIAILEQQFDTEHTTSIVLLSQEYRQIKESIIRILS